jgi:hypothetical protein
LQCLAPLLSLDKYDFVGLVKEDGTQEKYSLEGRDLYNAGLFIHDFSDTAGLIENLELLITVDSAPAHLAGAMNKSCWIMLASQPDFRWMLGRADSPWYPKAKLYRKELYGHWVDVVKKIGIDLLQRQ